MNHLKILENEAIHVMREVAAQFERPALLFSGGKDSIIMVHLAKRRFYPGRIPFPLIHIDTGHNFKETIEFRDKLVEETGARLIVGSVDESIAKGRVVEETGPEASRNGLQTICLLDTIKEHQIDAALGGGRRDEEKARAKERFFSHRDILANGIQKTKDLNSGTYITAEKTRGNSLEFSLSATGQKWTCGNILPWKTLIFRIYISLTKDQYSTEEEFGFQNLILLPDILMKSLKRKLLDSEQ